MIYTRWVTRHGDTSKSPTWAVLDDHGRNVDLSTWIVRAQVRTEPLSPAVDFTFTAGSGVAIGSATIDVNGRPVTTSTVQLYVDPDDWPAIPNPYTGVLDIEMASDTTAHPNEVHTLVEAVFVAEADVTRTQTGGGIG